MSYVRPGEDGSDVYIYGGHEGLVCSGCLLRRWEEGKEWGYGCPHYLTPVGMLAHLADHQRAGHVVGPRAFWHIYQEMLDGEIYPDMWEKEDA